MPETPRDGSGSEHRLLIGSTFPLEVVAPTHATPPPFDPERALMTVDGTSALFLALETIRPPRVWLPSYLCGVLATAADVAHVAHAFYPVDRDLRSDPSVVDVLAPGDAIVVIHYFGFLNPLAATIRATRADVILIEDGAQALLTTGVGQVGDLTVLSPRKFMGLPDGGVLLGRDELLPWLRPLERPPVDWWLGALRALLLRRDYDIRGGDREWFHLWRLADANDPVGPFRMTDLSRSLLVGGTDFGSMAERRRENYRHLLERLEDVALYPDLPDGVVPVGFPIRVRDRDAVRQRLFDALIFPAVHWPITGVVPDRFDDSHRLAGEIMTIPCDQRYGQAEMERIAGLLAGAVAATSHR